ncbi:efflux RND transporter periplasmic adaptor subunit [Bradyrhizobium sp. SZCCHNS1054]|uniref:efflux RND transporter periplasmic adaptor subunit n=1 Tax=Bradyrhizobium sp. SZCCHNS1054 TaxID=3057301 RepID=UPI0029167318|nr:HlyD family efflux transporter periplasmic adaptor subunit [Bradyrhizobium sp. SZCCHNS1054]
MAHRFNGLDRNQDGPSGATGLHSRAAADDRDRVEAQQAIDDIASVRPRRPAIAAGALIIVAAAVLIYCLSVGVPFTERAKILPEAERRPRTLVVTPTSISTRVVIAGVIAAGKTVPIVAPFDGLVREKRSQLGDRVAADDVLLVMDVGEIETRVREAQSAVLKAAMAVDALDRWEESADVTRAKRALEAADTELAVLERRVEETKALLDRGIVSRNEFDGLAQQRDRQRLTVAGAQQDLAAVRNRGNADNRKLADLDLLNARARLADLERQLEGTIVRSPDAGILTRPPPSASPGAENLATVEPGVKLARGQPVFAIADTTTLVVVGKVDEIDVGQIRIGQRAEITSDAFPGPPIAGQIVSVSAEAAPLQGGGRAPSFEVRASFAGEADAKGQWIRLGMSARMAVEVTAAAQAIVVPIEAVRDASTRPTVRVRDKQIGNIRDLPVTLGSTSEKGVVVLSGLSAGDEIVLP